MGFLFSTCLLVGGEILMNLKAMCSLSSTVEWLKENVSIQIWLVSLQASLSVLFMMTQG